MKVVNANQAACSVILFIKLLSSALDERRRWPVVEQAESKATTIMDALGIKQGRSHLSWPESVFLLGVMFTICFMGWLLLA